MYDVAVIGGGPAGLTAAIYATRKQLKVLIITKDIGGQAAISGDIENYLGYAMITGPELTTKFRHHIEEFKEQLILIEGQTVAKLEQTNPFVFKLTDSAGKAHEARTVIIASGRIPRWLGIPGEQEHIGRGVSTCATCDAPLFRGKSVAVIGGGNSAMDAAQALAKVATTVYILNVNPELRGDEILKQTLENASNVTHLTEVKTLEIRGGQFVESLVYASRSGEQKALPVQGVFIEVGQVPAVQFDTLTAKDQWGAVKVDSNYKTSVEGIWAAGDVNDKGKEQIIIAAGEGAEAALDAAEVLSRLPRG